MKLQQIRQSEREERKEERKEHILRCALEIFMSQGLEQATMKDIADASEIGIATLFRYFPTKKQLIIDTAAILWEQEFMQLPIYLPKDYEALKGIDQFQNLLEVFIFHYKKTPEVFRFLEQFDNYIANESVGFEQLVEVERIMLTLKEPITKAIQKGRQDGSIRPDFDIALFYMTSMHTMMSIIQKFILRGTIVHSDLEITGEAQIRLVIEMICDYIRSK